MKYKKLLVPVILLTLLILFLAFSTQDPNNSKFTSTYGYQHKTFGSSNSLDGKPLIIKDTATYEFNVKAKMKEGFLSITLLNSSRDKELLRIEGGTIDEKREITLEPEDYAVEIETHDAVDGEFTIKYGEIK